MDRNRPKKEQKLLDWVRPHLSDVKKFRMILDPKLEGNFSIKTAQKLAAVANRCLVKYPKVRPKMSEVLTMVNLVVEMTSATSTPQLNPVTSHKSKSESAKSRRERLKRRFVDPIVGENGWLAWRTWRPKVVTTCQTGPNEQGET